MDTEAAHTSSAKSHVEAADELDAMTKGNRKDTKTARVVGINRSGLQYFGKVFVHGFNII